MKIKLFDESIDEINPGFPHEIFLSKRFDVSEYELDNKWHKNNFFDLQKSIDKKNKEIELKRKQRYEKETDPMFFSIERQSSTKEEWLAAVEKIKKELPYYE